MDHNRATVFKGCTRPAMKFGVPLIPLMVIGFTVMAIGGFTSILVNLVSIPIIAGAGLLTKADDQIFRQMWLWFLHRVMHRNPIADRDSQAATYLIKESNNG